MAFLIEQPQMAMLLAILGLTAALLILDLIRIDLVAILCMLALGWSGILTPAEMFSGFSSQAVVVVMAVMVMGRAIDRSGLMERFSAFLLARAGRSQDRIIIWFSLAAGILSAFIQNIGAIALFLPAIMRVARRSKIPPAKLIMPVGFASILGGTLTIVASGPLLLVNDLLADASLLPYGIFSVTPVGLLLLFAGTAYFLLFGERVLPQGSSRAELKPDQEQLIERLNLPNNKWHLSIPVESPIVGTTAEESGVIRDPLVHILAMLKGGELEYAPWRETMFEAGQEIVVLGDADAVQRFADENKLVKPDQAARFEELFDPHKSGFAEVIIPDGSELSGKTIRNYQIRKRFAVEPMLLFSRGEAVEGDISDHPIRAGDKMVVYGLWERIDELRNSIDFVVASVSEQERERRPIRWSAAACFAGAVGLALAGFPVALSFLSGAVAMVLTGNLRMQEMYEAINWRVVFLLAGLIPLGIAMEKTGAAALFAEYLISATMNGSPFLILIAVGILATLFSLFMSNVGAIVVLAPVIVEMAAIGGFDARPMVLMAAVCTANSFIIPTHQVNAFILSPGGYQNADYFRAGVGMTLIFLLITIPYFYFFMI